MARHLLRGTYVLVALVVCPLLAWNLAVAAATRGVGWTGFFAVLLGVPVVGALAAAVALRRRHGEAAVGAVGAGLATVVLVVALVYAWLSSR